MVIYNKKMKIMKKLIFTTMAISALFLSVSCQKENANDAPKGEGVVFTAYVDGVDPDTKTVIGKNESNKTVSKWSGDERIWILNGTGAWKKAFVATAAEPSEKVIFSEESTEAALEGNNYIAVYPASPADGSWWNYGEGNYYVDKLWLTNSQTATAGSYDPSAHIALAHTTTNSLYFKNMVALLKFTAKSANVTSIKVTVSENEALAGNFSCDPVNEKIATNHVQDYKYALYNYVELKGTFEAGKDYYIAVLPGTYSSLELSVNGNVVKTKADGASFRRNKIYDMGEVDADYPVCKYGLVGGFNNWNASALYQLKDTNSDFIYEYKGLKVDENGFKFVNDSAWYSTLTGGISVGKWFNIHSSQNENIKPAAGTYDVYVKTDEFGTFCCLVEAGAAMPEFIPKNKQLYIVIQDNENWWTNKCLYSWKVDDDSKLLGEWPGVDKTGDVTLWGNSNHQYWSIPTTVNGLNIGVIFKNKDYDGDSNQTSNIIIDSFSRDFAFYFDKEDSYDGSKRKVKGMSF